MTDSKMRLFATVAIATVLAGCQTVTSRHVGLGVALDSRTPPDCTPDPVLNPALARVPRSVLCDGGNAESTEKATANAAGLTYFLPRQLARVTATRTDLRIDALITALIKAQGELDAAKAAVVAARAALTQTEQSIIAAAGGEPARPILAARMTDQLAALAAAIAAIPGKQTALDTAKAALTSEAPAISAENNLAGARAASTRADRDVTEIQSLIGATTAEEDLLRHQTTLPDLQTEQAASLVRLADAETAYTRATGNPPPMVASSLPPPRFKVTLKIELLAPTADPSIAYRLSPRHSLLRDDTHDFVVSSGGLLTSTNTIAVDRTADILVEIGTFAGAISGLSARFGPMGGAEGAKSREVAPDPCLRAPNEFTGVVDFASISDVTRLNEHMQCLGVRTQVVGLVWPNSSRPATDSAGNVDGIVYRNPVEVEVQIEKCLDINGTCTPDSSDWRVTEVIALALPQAGPISYIPQDAGFMTRTQYELAFKDGILTNYDASRPSEILHLVATPMRIVEGVFAGASRVLSLRTGQNTALASLSASELALLNASIGLQAGQINGQATLNSARVAALNAEFALRAAQLAGETGLTNAQTTALNAEYTLRLAQINGEAGVQTAQTNSQTSLNTGQLSFLQSQVGLATSGNSAAAQLLASGLALTVAQLRDQSRREALSRCIAQQQSLSAPIDVCLAGI